MLRTKYLSKDKTVIGYGCAFVSSALFGSITTLAKPTVDAVNPLVLASLVSLIAAAILWPLKGKTKPKWTTKNYGMILSVSILGAVLAPALYFVGLEYTTATNATILSNSEIVFTIVIALMFFREKLNRFGYLSFGLVGFGIFMITTDFDLSKIELANIGNLFVLATMACWALDNNISKVLTKHVEVATIIKLKSLIGGSILAVIVLLSGISFTIPTDNITNIVLLGGIGFAAPLFFFYNAIKRIGAVRTILIFSTSAIFGVIYAAIFLQEQIKQTEIIAMGIMILGILFLYKDKTQ